MPKNPDSSTFNTWTSPKTLPTNEVFLCADNGGVRKVWKRDALPGGRGYRIESGCSVIGCLKMYLEIVTNRGNNVVDLDDWHTCYTDEYFE